MIKKIIFTTITILWLLVIFMFSDQKGIKSSNISDSFIDSTIVNIYKLFDRDCSIEKQEEIVEMFSYPVRKLAHFTEYFILGVLILITFKLYNIKNIYFMILFCLLYAVSDEIHQLFIIGRSCSVIDMLIDTLGSTCGIICFTKKIK